MLSSLASTLSSWAHLWFRSSRTWSQLSGKRPSGLAWPCCNSWINPCPGSCLLLGPHPGPGPVGSHRGLVSKVGLMGSSGQMGVGGRQLSPRRWRASSSAVNAGWAGGLGGPGGCLSFHTLFCRCGHPGASPACLHTRVFVELETVLSLAHQQDSKGFEE